VQEHETKIILTGHGRIETPANCQEGMDGLVQHQFCRDWQWELMVIGNLNKLMEEIRNGQGYVVSDGSFQAGRGAAAWIIEGRLNNNRIIGTCLSPSSKDGHS